MSLQEIWNLGEKKLNIFEDHKNDEKMKRLSTFLDRKTQRN